MKITRFNEDCKRRFEHFQLICYQNLSSKKSLEINLFIEH